MKCQSLFSGKNKKNISKCHTLNFLPSMLNIKKKKTKKKQKKAYIKYISSTTTNNIYVYIITLLFNLTLCILGKNFSRRHFSYFS